MTNTAIEVRNVDEAGEELMTVKEVARWLRLSLAEVYRLIRSGEVSHYRVGPGNGAIRLKRSDVSSFLETRREGPKPAPAVATRAPSLKHIRRKSS